MEIKRFHTTCADGVRLEGLLLLPTTLKAVIQFNGGTAVKKEYYLPFLKFLAGHGYLCCLWDYRGSGSSTAEDLAHSTFRFSEYGTQDMNAIRSYLKGAYGELPYFIVAHSVGGQQLGFMEDLSDIVGVVNFGVSAGYYPYMPWKYRLKAYFFFYIFAPLSTWLTGYAQAKRFGIMEDLPRGVWREWGDWLKVEHYFFDERFYGKTVPIGQFTSYTFPIRLFWAADDTIACEKNLAGYWDNIASTAPITFTQLLPKEYGVTKIDHFGFFKSTMQETLWQEVLTQLSVWYEERVLRSQS